MSDFTNLADDYIEEALSEARLNGKALSPQELATEFSKHDCEARVQHLKTLKSAPFSTPREAAQRHVYESALLSTHHRLRKIER